MTGLQSLTPEQEMARQELLKVHSQIYEFMGDNNSSEHPLRFQHTRLRFEETLQELFGRQGELYHLVRQSRGDGCLAYTSSCLS